MMTMSYLMMPLVAFLVFLTSQQSSQTVTVLALILNNKRKLAYGPRNEFSVN